MKNIRYILGIMLGICLMVSGCQNLTDPEYTVPTIETKDVMNVTSTQATFNGKIEDVFQNYQYHKIYLLLSTSADMSNAEEHSFFGANEYISVDKLTPETTYYYVTCASDGVTEIRGEVKSFITLGSIRLISVTSTTWDGSQEEYSPDMLGAYLFYANEPEIYQKHGNMYIEKPIVSTEGWKLPQEILPTSTKLKMCGYFPYQEKYSYSEYLIPFGTYKYDEDVLWGVSNILDEQTPDASIQMQHAMARVVFSITGTATVLETTVITNFRIANRNEASGIPTYGYLNLYSGDFERCSYGEDIYRSTQLHPTDVAQNIEILTFPAEFSNEAARLTLGTKDGHQVSVNLPETRWEAGHQYTYPVTYDEAHITIGNVIVEEWNNNNAGDITVND